MSKPTSIKLHMTIKDLCGPDEELKVLAIRSTFDNFVHKEHIRMLEGEVVKLRRQNASLRGRIEEFQASPIHMSIIEELALRLKKLENQTAKG
jgi:hypothetical protein